MFSFVCSLIYLPSVFSNPQPTYREDVVQATPIVHVANRAVVPVREDALHPGVVSSAWTSWRPWRMQVLSLKTLLTTTRMNIKLGTSRWSRVMLLAVGDEI